MAGVLSRVDFAQLQNELFRHDDDSGEEFIGFEEEDLIQGNINNNSDSDGDEVPSEDFDLEDWHSVEADGDVIPGWCPAYGQRQGLKVVMESHEPVEFFKLFFTDDLFNHIMMETNVYAYEVSYCSIHK
jgi:hypothetical protein